MMRIAYALLWVHDQDEALAFYTEKLGWEVRADVTLAEVGNFRWLTVGPTGQPDVAVVLNAIPGPPVIDPEAAEQLRNLMAKGFAGTVLLTSEDVQATYEELTGRGVEFVEPPEGHPYGIDSAFRDPSGNFLRLMQLREPPPGGRDGSEGLARGAGAT
jgi:catechol 2,3-dioxygenase-like lactoylglutathione lyase family enzyme